MSLTWFLSGQYGNAWQKWCIWYSKPHGQIKEYAWSHTWNCDEIPISSATFKGRVVRTSDGFDYITNTEKICFLSNMDQWCAHGEGRRSTEPPFKLQIFKICRRQCQHHDQFVPLDMKGCICHFTKWQIHHFISEGKNNWYLDKREKNSRYSLCASRICIVDSKYIHISDR